MSLEGLQGPGPPEGPPRPPSVGLHILAKDAAGELPHLLSSIELAFDQIVVVLDDRTKDATETIFRDWVVQEEARRAQAIGAGQIPDHGLEFAKVVPYTWTHDFAAARNLADSLLDTEWRSWADCDDQISGAHNLRRMAAQAKPTTTAFIAGYNYAQDQLGNSLSYLKRERLIRAATCPGWTNRVHEAQTLADHGVEFVDAGTVEWVHQKPVTPDEQQAGVSASNSRNLSILRKWVKDEPRNPRVLAYLGTESAIAGNHKTALKWYKRYIALGPGWDEERAQIYRKLAMSQMAMGDYKAARTGALEALDVLPRWPDSYLTLAETCVAMGEPAKAVDWAQEVLRRGAPETMLITNSLDYTFQPRLVLAGALADLGQIDQAIAVAKEALHLVPYHGLLRDKFAKWQAEAKREHTAQTWASAIEMLVAHDEQLKAKWMLDTVPYFATDHPAILRCKGMIAHRLAFLDVEDGYEEFYEGGGAGDGAAEEHFVPDDKVDPLCEYLPRAQSLLAGLKEQAGLK